VRPDGSAMLPPMPYGYLAQMTADDLAAVIENLEALHAFGEVADNRSSLYTTSAP